MSDSRAERLVRAIFKLRTPPPAGSPHYVSGWETALDAAADVVRQDAEGDELNPSTTELSETERGMLRFALELAEERMFSRGDEFSEADHEAVKSLKRLAGGEER